ncbi:MAG: FAD-dependent oxidoreductase [Eubacteriales bacterium]
MNTIEFSMSIPVRDSYDIVVCGGGIAGCAAALEGARHGKKVLLLEKSTVLGGLATMGLINFFVPMCNGRGTQICRGMAEEFLRLSITYGYDTIPEPWKNGEPTEPTAVRYMTSYSPYLFAMQLTELLTNAGVKLLFDCIASYPIMDGGHCTGVVTDSKSGLEFYGARQVIDTTGDCDIVKRAGIPTVDGRNFYTYIAREVTLDSCREAIESGRAERAVIGVHGGNANLYGGGQPEGVPLYWGSDVETVSDYLIHNQRDLLGKLKKNDRFSREVTTLPMMPQFRTTRRIDGDITVHEEDHYRHFDDSVCAICDFDRRDYLYEVPLRSLTRRGYDNIMTAGRSASADGYAWDVFRVIPPAILTGQAAAVTACHAIDTGCAVADGDIRAIQSTLESENVMIHFDDSLIPEGKGGADGHAEGHL